MIEPASATNTADVRSQPAIEAKGLQKRYGGKEVVRNVSLRVESGSIFGLLGPNGAGKSTTIRMLLGLVDPDAGIRRVLGTDHPLSIAIQIGYLPEERGLYPSMKADEAVAFLGALRGLPLSQGRLRARELLGEYGIPPNQQIRNLSKGMAQLVQVMGAIVHRPKLLILDEPFSGLDPLNQERLETLIKDFASNGTTVLLSTHVIPHAERLCDKIVIIDGGAVAFDGSLDLARSRLPARVEATFSGSSADKIQALLPAGSRSTGDVWCFEAPPSEVPTIIGRAMGEGLNLASLTVERPSLQDVFRSILAR